MHTMLSNMSRTTADTVSLRVPVSRSSSAGYVAGGRGFLHQFDKQTQMLVRREQDAREDGLCMEYSHQRILLSLTQLSL